MSKPKRYAVFHDTVRGTVHAVDDRFAQVKDAISTSNAPSLLVRIAATHAALKTSNKGFYLPERMRDGTGSFLTPYRKPVLTHHDDFKDPIGRVVSARYVDLSTRYPINDTELQRLSQGGLEGKDLQSAVQYILNNFDDRDDYEGLGYVELVAEISDPASMDKVLDQRYLTVSTAHSTDKAMCSVCLQDWVADGMCDHEPGDSYDGVHAVLLPGQHIYSEVSFVNKPADRAARTVDIVEGDASRRRYDGDYDENVRDVDMALFCKGPACIFDLASEAQISLQDNEGPLEEVIDLMSDKTREQEVLSLLTAALEDTSKDLPEELVKDEESLKLAHSLLTINCCDEKEADSIDGKAELSKKLRDKAGEMEVGDLEDNEVELQVKADEEAAATAAAADADAADQEEKEECPKGQKMVKGKCVPEKESDDQTTDQDGQTDGDDAGDVTEDGDQELLDLKEILDTEKSYEKMKEHIGEDQHLDEVNLGLLRASDFAYPKDRAFPCYDCEHIDAALKVLEGYDAPGVKDAIVEALDRKKASLKCTKEDDKGSEECNEEDMDKIPMDQINDFIDAMAAALPGDDEVLEVTDETEDLLDEQEIADARPQDKPGGSNVGKYKTGPFCGPAGGAPKGSYPVNTRKRAISALSYARHAPNPSGIKSCVCKHHPGLPACGSKKDAVDVTVEELRAELKKAEEKLAALKQDLETRDAKLEVQQDQLTVFEDDYRVLSEENVQLTQELKDRLASRAIELRTLRGESIEDVDAARDEFLAQDTSDMRDTVRGLEESFDLEGAAKRLNDGMARDPEGTVKDPTARSDATGDDDSPGAEQIPSAKDVMATYNRIDAVAGSKAAREFLDSVKAKYGKHLKFEETEGTEEDDN